MNPVNDETWENTYDILRFYIYTHNKMPTSENISGMDEWIRIQKLHLEEGILPIEKVKLLSNLQLWSWGIRKRWEDRYVELVNFIKNNGYFPTQTDGSIGKWAGVQRKKYNDGKIKKEYMKLWEKIPDFNAKVVSRQERISSEFKLQRSSVSWEINYSRLADFIKTNNALPAIRSGQLGEWCKKQRTFQRNGKLTDYQINLLEKLPLWQWNVSTGKKRKAATDVQRDTNKKSKLNQTPSSESKKMDINYILNDTD